MASFDFVVDTNTLAQSVSTVTEHVNATTVAVTAMEAAVIAVEKKSADKICENVDRGFFSLIKSQVSMKLANYYTDMNAKLVLLMQFSKSLLQLQGRMEDDYNRLKREYFKIFNALDNACENRISQLDAHAMNLAKSRNELIYGRMQKDTASTFVYGYDTHNSAQMCYTARIKSKTNKAIESLADSARDNQAYKSQLGRVFYDKYVTEAEEQYIPILYTEESAFVGRTVLNHIYYPDYVSAKDKSLIDNKISSNLERIFSTGLSDDEKANIRKEFMMYLNEPGLSDRVKNQMLALLDQGGCI